MRKTPVSIRVNPMVVYEIEIVPLSGIVTKPDIGHNNIFCPVVLNEDTGRKFCGESRHYF
jgi:hypothetical protein